MRKFGDNFYYHDKDYPVILSYGFRPFFLILPLYIIFNMIFWVFYWQGILPGNSLTNPVIWHIFELLFGVGTASIASFILTAIPELFPKVLPKVGKYLLGMVILWLLGRLSFYFIEYTGIILCGFFNISLLVWIISIAFKPIFFDKKRKQISIALALVLVTMIEILFFATILEIINLDLMQIFKLAIGSFMLLILLALRRVNTEALNFYLEDKGITEIYYARGYRYNIAYFAVILFSLVQFFYGNNTVLGWLGFAAMAGILGTLSDFKLKDYFILHYAYVVFLGSILIFMAFGYGFLGYSYFNDSINLNHYEHFLTSGAFGISIFLTMIIISHIHTGRQLKATKTAWAGVALLSIATILRVSVGYYPEHSQYLYSISGILWVIPFVLYFINYKKILLSPRVDGYPG